MHEFVATAKALKDATGIRAMDVAKRLIDLGYHPSTVYFPLVVDEAMMVEPTETETKETLEAFAAAMRQAAAEARTDPDLLHEAPVTTPGPPAGRGASGPAPQAPMGIAGHARLMPSRSTDPLAEDPFAYRVTKDGRVRIERGGRTVTVVAGKDAPQRSRVQARRRGRRRRPAAPRACDRATTAGATNGEGEERRAARLFHNVT